MLKVIFEELNKYIMRLKLLFTLFSVISVFSYAQTISIPDTNFEQALIELGLDTNGLNGNILQSEAEAITELDVSDKSISTMLGSNKTWEQPSKSVTNVKPPN